MEFGSFDAARSNLWYILIRNHVVKTGPLRRLFNKPLEHLCECFQTFIIVIAQLVSSKTKYTARSHIREKPQGLNINTAPKIYQGFARQL
jgi:hypothetical protein